MKLVRKDNVLSRISPRVPLQKRVLLQARVERDLRDSAIRIMNQNFPNGWTWGDLFTATLQGLIDSDKPK